MPPILVAHLFPALSGCLVELLRSIPPAAWELPTVSSRRSVKDIVSHLLDGSLRRLSLQRDGYRPDERGQPRPGEPLIAFLNRLNDEWETATRRLSPRLLIDLIEAADPQFARFMQSLDPHAPAIFPVAWAGEDQSANWMDVAREYTEKWHHTQQIFEATGQPSTIMTRRLGQPCFDIFLRALPFTFHGVPAAVGSAVTVEVTGEAGGAWHVERQTDGWRQVAQAPDRVTATVTLDQGAAWKLVTKRRSLAAVREQFPEIRIAGDVNLGSYVLEMVSVMA
jgi:hypothetical protein